MQVKFADREPELAHHLAFSKTSEGETLLVTGTQVGYIVRETILVSGIQVGYCEGDYPCVRDTGRIL